MLTSLVLLIHAEGIFNHVDIPFILNRHKEVFFFFAHCCIVPSIGGIYVNYYLPGIFGARKGA